MFPIIQIISSCSFLVQECSIPLSLPISSEDWSISQPESIPNNNTYNNNIHIGISTVSISNKSRRPVAMRNQCYKCVFGRTQGVSARQYGRERLLCLLHSSLSRVKALKLHFQKQYLYQLRFDLFFQKALLIASYFCFGSSRF